MIRPLQQQSLLRGAIHPDELEAAIDTEFLVLCSAKSPWARRLALTQLEDLVKQRSEIRVAEMEIERGLR